MNFVLFQQAVLVRQLQEQHYYQYMQQLMLQQHQAVQTVNNQTEDEGGDTNVNDSLENGVEESDGKFSSDGKVYVLIV